jgi:hypothetical protein
MSVAPAPGVPGAPAAPAAPASQLSVAGVTHVRKTLKTKLTITRNVDEMKREVDEMKAQANEHSRKLGETHCTLHPNHSAFLGRWNIAISIALAYTALVTPYELVFRGKPKVDGIFVANRMFDIVFIADICLQFFVAIFDKGNGSWILDLPSIRQRYIQGSFVMDCMSTFPYDIFDFINLGAEASNLKGLRILKLLKLAKMLRLLKGMRGLLVIQDMLGLSNRMASISGLSLLFILGTHWMACLFGLLTGTQFQKESWATGLGILKADSDADDNIEQLYPFCLYFAVNAMVMGESEDTAPNTKHDRTVSIICMLLGGLFYAYLIGSVTENMNQKDPASTEFLEFCDLVTKYGADNNLPRDIRVRMAEYYASSRDVFTSRWYSKVFHTMPESMQKEVAVYLYHKWLVKVPFLNCEDEGERIKFTSHVATLLRTSAFPSDTVVAVLGVRCDTMHIITKGMASKTRRSHGKLLGAVPMPPGSFFGQEMILQEGRHLATVRTVTFLFCVHFTQETFAAFLEQTSHAYKATTTKVKRARLAMQLKEVFITVAMCVRVAQKRGRLATEEYKSYKKMLLNQGKIKSGRVREESRNLSDTKPVGHAEQELLRTKMQELHPELMVMINAKVSEATAKKMKAMKSELKKRATLHTSLSLVGYVDSSTGPPVDIGIAGSGSVDSSTGPRARVRARGPPVDTYASKGGASDLSFSGQHARVEARPPAPDMARPAVPDLDTDGQIAPSTLRHDHGAPHSMHPSNSGSQYNAECGNVTP